MFNPMNMMGNGMGMPNPQNMRAMIENMCRNNPMAQRAWAAAQQMTQGKSQEKRLEIAKNLAKEKGIPFEEFKEMAKQYGINLP